MIEARLGLESHAYGICVHLHAAMPKAIAGVDAKAGPAVPLEVFQQLCEVHALRFLCRLALEDLQHAHRIESFCIWLLTISTSGGFYLWETYWHAGITLRLRRAALADSEAMAPIRALADALATRRVLGLRHDFHASNVRRKVLRVLFAVRVRVVAVTGLELSGERVVVFLVVAAAVA
jgi:hypothetical protein